VRIAYTKPRSKRYIILYIVMPVVHILVAIRTKKTEKVDVHKSTDDLNTK